VDADTAQFEDRTSPTEILFLEEAKNARKNAYAPYSGYRVGVALETKNGSLITGCNVECVDYTGLEAIESAISRLVSLQDWRKDSDSACVTRAVFAVPRLDYESLVHYPSPKSLGRLRFFAHDTLHMTFVDESGQSEDCTLDDLLPRSPNIHQSMARFSHQTPISMPPRTAHDSAATHPLVDDDILGLLDTTRRHSIAPSSGYTVSVVVKSTAGHLYSGCNVETAMHSAIHAEESALSNMICAEGPTAKLDTVYVLTSGDKAGWPCGNCRQKLYEFAHEKTLIRAVNQQGEYEEKPLTELLPNGFTAAHIPATGGDTPAS